MTREILRELSKSGCVYFPASSPYSPHFPVYVIRKLISTFRKKKNIQEKEENQRFNNAFYYLRRKGYLDIRKKGKQIYISLTKEGRKKAGKYSVDNLEIKKPKIWDKKWRIVVFDIPNLTKIKREAFRGKLKELGFYKLQQSVWIYPYDCRKEIGLLRQFFGLNQKELKLVAGEIEKDASLREIFKL